MVKRLISLGLGLTPFIFWQGADPRLPKEITAVCLALAIGLWAIFEGGLKRFENKWLLLFIGFLILSHYQAPKFGVFAGFVNDRGTLNVAVNRNITGIWDFKAIAFAIIYLLLTVTVASQDFSITEIKRTFTVIAICGFVMSLYIFVQKMGLDQYFAKAPETLNPDVNHLEQPVLVGTLGHSTIVSPFIACCIPFALFSRRYFWVIAMVAAVIFTESHVAMTAMIVSLGFYFLARKPWLVFFITILLLACYKPVVKHINAHPEAVEHILNTNGRTSMWQDVFRDWQTPPIPQNNRKYTITGFGPGAFEYVYSMRYGSRWFQAHNEYLETLYNSGIVGFGLLLMAVWWLIKNIVITIKTFYGVNMGAIVTLGAGLLCLMVCSAGTFVWHIGTFAFYTAVFVGLLHNRSVIINQSP